MKVSVKHSSLFQERSELLLLESFIRFGRANNRMKRLKIKVETTGTKSFVFSNYFCLFVFYLGCVHTDVYKWKVGNTFGSVLHMPSWPSLMFTRPEPNWVKHLS